MHLPPPPILADILDKCGEPICTVFFGGSYNRADYFGRVNFAALCKLAAQCDGRNFPGKSHTLTITT